MSATLRVTRHVIGVEVRRGRYDVWVDDRCVGSMELGQAFETALEPGRHSLQIRNGRNTSRVLGFDVGEGQAMAFNCNGKSLLPIFLLSFFVPRLAISLYRVR